MKKIIFAMLLLALLLSCGQDNYYSIYPDLHATSVILDNDEGYILGCYVNTGYDVSAESIIYRINSHGEVIWTLNLPDVSEVNTIISSSSNSYIALCNGETMNGAQISLICFDSDGEKKWESVYNEIPSSTGRKLIATQDGGYLAAGSAGRISSMEGLLVKFSTDGSVAWSRTYYSNQISYFADVIENESGFVAFGNAMNESFSGDAWLVNTDHAGQEILNKTIDLGYDSNGCGIVRSDDGYIALCGTSARDHIDPVVAFIDRSFKTVEYKSYGAVSLLEFPVDLEFCPNGNIAIAASRFTADQNCSGVFMIEINTDGDLIRQREYLPASGNLIPTDLLVLPNSGIVICGNRHLPGGELSESDAFVLKSNSNWQVELTNN